MKRNKGFTLIELLAVIVILAIIALIATPIILNVIENAKEGAAESSGLGYVDAVEKQAMINEVDKTKTSITDNTYTVAELDSYSVNAKGDKPSSDSWVTLVKGQVTACSLKIKDYIVNCEGKNKVTGEKGSTLVTKPNGGSVAVKTYSLGELVYFDPVSTDACNESTYTGTNTCYKWRAIEIDDNNSKSSITLQMDHNLINLSAWAPSINTTGPVTALTALNTATSSWSRVDNLTYEYDTVAATSNYGKMICTDGTCTLNGTSVSGIARARMITGEEVRNIINTKVTDSSAISKTWTVASSYSDYFYFSNTGYTLGTKKSGTGDTELAWLVENTRVYNNSGATSNGTDNYGYWILSPVSDYADFAWFVCYYGRLNYRSVNNVSSYGVRPVINVSKSNVS